MLLQEVRLRAPSRRRPASTACAAARCPSSASSCARSRRSAASTASTSASSGRYFDEAESRPGVTGENLLTPARDAPRQRHLPDGLRDQPRPGAPARQPRPLPVNGRRPTSRRTTFAPGDRVEVREGAASPTATSRPRARRSGRPGPGLADASSRQAGRQRDRAAAPRPDAGRAQRAARGRVLLEVVADDDRTGEPTDRVGRGADA